MGSNLRRLMLLLVLAIAAHFAFRQAADQATARVREPLASAPAVSGGPVSGAAGSDPRLGPCDVTHVTDGDTLRVRCGSREEPVRLLQIDTAERTATTLPDADLRDDQPAFGRHRAVSFDAVGEGGIGGVGGTEVGLANHLVTVRQVHVPSVAPVPPRVAAMPG